MESKSDCICFQIVSQIFTGENFHLDILFLRLDVNPNYNGKGTVNAKIQDSENKFRVIEEHLNHNSYKQNACLY